MISTELGMVPSGIHKEQEKFYNQVPPMNRAVIRKAIIKLIKGVRKVDSDGVPVPGMECRIVDLEAGTIDMRRVKPARLFYLALK